MVLDTTLPEDPKKRKEYPIGTGVLDYFPDAIAAVSHVSYVGNQQHNPGEPMHWARGKSMDQADTMLRHFLARGTIDTDGQRHSAKMVWRALAILQLEIEADNERTNTTGRSSNDGSDAATKEPHDPRAIERSRSSQADQRLSGTSLSGVFDHNGKVECGNSRERSQSSYLGSIPATSPMVDSDSPTGHGADSGTTGFSFREDPNVVARWEAACRADDTDWGIAK